MSPLPRKNLLFAWGRATLIVVLVFGIQGCNRATHVNEDPTGISEADYARQKALETNLGVHASLSGLGQLIKGMVIPSEIGPKAIRVSPEQEKVADKLLELYVQAARQAPAVKRELFHEIEELELRNRDISALVWWLDREAIAYPDESAAIQEKKRGLRDDDGRYHGGRTETVHLLIWNEYFNQAILDDFERENERINVRVYNYNTNEQLLQLLQTEADLQTKFKVTSTPHGFDIAMPSDFCVAILAEKGWLVPVIENPTRDHDEFRQNLTLIDDDFRELIGRQSAPINVDLNRYCIPYRWSVAGIAYNSTFVDDIPFSWGALFDPVDLSGYALRARYRKMSMLLDPRLDIETVLLYLANMRTESPHMRTIETAERLLTDSRIISDGLLRLAPDGPVSRLLLDDLGRLLDNLRKPRGYPLEEFAEVFAHLQQELVWMLLSLDARETSAMPGSSPSPASPGTGDSGRTPFLPPASANPVLRSNPVVDSMRQLTLVSYDDLRLAVLFLKKIADLEDRVDLLLTRSALSGDAGKGSGTHASPEAPEGEASEHLEELRSLREYSAPDCLRQTGALQAALRTFKEALDSDRPPRFDELAENFSTLERRANSLLGDPSPCSLEAKIETAINLLFSGAGVAEPEKTEKMVSLLMRQDTSEAALNNPETQSKIDEALTFLQEQSSYVSYFLSDSDTRAQLVSEKVVLAQATGTDTAWAALRNGKIRFSVPEEGVFGSVDSFVILKDGGVKRNIDACRTFLSYLLRPETAARMVNFSKYASTEGAAAAFVDPEVRNGAAYMRPRDLMNVRLLPVLRDETRKIYAHGTAPLVPSNVLHEHPEYRKTKSLFGVLFEAQRPPSQGF
jgi:spermidine/putrescine-binding protein